MNSKPKSHPIQAPDEHEREDPISKTEEILIRLEELDSGKSELLSIGVLLLLVIVMTWLAFAAPETAWDLGPIALQGRYVPQIIFVFVTVIVLINANALRQRSITRNTREELVRQLLRADAAEHLSRIDPLTGLWNRRHMDVVLANEEKRTRRTKLGLSILMLDLDDFGSLNKNHGHIEGDRMLKEVADILLAVFRQTDTAVRFGGDEFIIVMPDTNAEQAQIAMRRLADRVKLYNQKSDRAFVLAMSVGSATVDPDAGYTAAVALADERLRTNKLARRPATVVPPGAPADDEPRVRS